MALEIKAEHNPHWPVNATEPEIQGEHSPAELIDMVRNASLGFRPGERYAYSNTNISSGAVAQYPSIIAGVSDALIEDIRLDSIYMGQTGGGTMAWATIDPPDRVAGYPEADMFGILPATGFYLRHARTLQFSNVEVATESADQRSAIWAADVEDLDVFRLRAPKVVPSFNLRNVTGFRSFGGRNNADRVEAAVQRLEF
jgi:hypothetical protein